MINKHKQKRMKKRSIWKKIDHDKNFIKPLYYDKLKLYENRKAKKFRKYKNTKTSITNYKDNQEETKIKLHKHIDFEDNIENLVTITKDIDNFMKSSLKEKFSIDHKKIETITIGGLLYLVGQISKITTAKYNDGKYHLKYNKKIGLKNNDRIKYLFYKIGYWNYFGISKPYKLNQGAMDNYFLSIETSNISNVDLLNKIKRFINDNVNFLQDDYSLEYQFDDTIKEAMGNSIEHAYNHDFSELGKERGKWWICGHYDKQNNSLELVFYDYGIGIRNSMKYNLGTEADRVLMDKIKDSSRSDADLIEIAINGNLTKYEKYKKHDRGKGFKRFKNFAKASGFDCELTIVSNTGKYKLSYNGSSKTETVSKTKLSGNIDGMLIKWKINLKRN